MGDYARRHVGRAPAPALRRVLLGLAGLVMAQQIHAVEPGQAAPDCLLAQLGATPPVDLRELRGRVVYVDFWASWCAPCRKAFPFLNMLEAELGQRGLQVIGVNVDEDAASARKFLERVPARFSVGRDQGGRCPRAFGVQAMPSSYLIDRSGVVRYVHLGFRPEDAALLRGRVEQLLAETGGR